MSKESLNRFCQRIMQDSVLQEQFMQFSNPANSVQRLVQMGAEHGYSFTLDEVEFAVSVALQDLSQSDMQLGVWLCDRLNVPRLTHHPTA